MPSSASPPAPAAERGVIARLQSASPRAIRRAEWVALGLLAAIAFALWLAYPVAPTFDSAWALVWGHQILAGHVPDFAAYRAPTEHPLWVIFGMLCAALGSAGPRAMTFVGVVSLLVVVIGLYRLSRVAFGTFAALISCVLLLSRFHFAFYGAFAYLDVPYIGLLVWAAVLEAERPRRGGSVWVLLILAGLLRPDAWLYTLCYAIWLGWHESRAKQVRLLCMVAVPAILWALLDFAVTGSATFSFTFTTGHAEELARTEPISAIPGSVLSGLLDLAKPPVLIAAVLGVGLAYRRMEHKRYAVQLALAIAGIASFVITSAAGFSVVNRYLALASVALMCFAGYLLAELLILILSRRHETPVLVAAAIALIIAGAGWEAFHLSPGGAASELTLRVKLESEVSSLLRSPAVVAARRCGPISVPNHKLMPLLLIDLGTPPIRDVVARSDTSTARARQYGAAFVMRGGSRVLYDSEYGPYANNSLDPKSINYPPKGFKLQLTDRYLAVYTRCPAAVG
ncbi:MAG: hypothetical protein ABSG64_11065 [Solirubrobacteraceae bacterium]